MSVSRDRRDKLINSVNPATLCDDASWNKAGPSGCAKQRRVSCRVDIQFDALPSDEESVQTTGSSPIHRVNRIARRRKSVPSPTCRVAQEDIHPKEVIVLSTSDDERKSVPSVTYKVAQEDIHPPEVIVLSTSDDDDYNSIVRTKKKINKKTRDRVRQNTPTIKKVKHETNVCDNVTDLIRQAKANAVSVKLTNNKDMKLVAKAHKLNRLVEDSETDDEREEKENKDETHMESTKNKSPNEKKQKSSKPIAITAKNEPPSDIPRNAALEPFSVFRVQPIQRPKSFNCTRLRPLYSHTETIEMINYLVRTKSIAYAKGRTIFTAMSRYKTLNHRSASSLYNRFHKILPEIDKWTVQLGLHPDIKKQFERLRQPKR